MIDLISKSSDGSVTQYIAVLYERGYYKIELPLYFRAMILVAIEKSPIVNKDNGLLLRFRSEGDANLLNRLDV